MSSVPLPLPAVTALPFSAQNAPSSSIVSSSTPPAPTGGGFLS